MSKNPQAIMDSVKVCDLSDSQDSQESQESDPEDQAGQEKRETRIRKPSQKMVENEKQRKMGMEY